MTPARLIVGVAVALMATSGRAANSNTVRVSVLSKIDQDLGVYWINSWKKGTLVRQKEEPIVGQGTLNIDSYFGHSFLVVEEAHTEGLDAYNDHMWDPKIMTKFTMGEFDLEVYVSRDEDGHLKVALESALTRTETLMEKASKMCQQKPEVMKAAAKKKGLAAVEGSCAIGGGDADDLSPEFSACLTRAIADDLAKKEKEANKSMRMLEIVGDRARNYTCVDPEMETTNTTLSTLNWKDPEGGRTYHAKMFLDDPSAKIYLLDNFASDAECKALMSKASPHLQDATVNAGGGKSTLSSARRAKAGGVPPDLKDPKSVTAPLYRRGYAFANHVTGYNMQLDGQEGYSVIKYGPDDEYRPHCDGDCTGSEYRPGGRVATMVIYCESAKAGGGTTFSSSDVFVKGKKGQAVFFSYLGPDNRTDAGRTRHSGCPILKGTKWIATLWMRLGVTAERGWQYYDPSGMPSEFALARSKGAVSASEVEETEAQKSAVDGVETAEVIRTETIGQALDHDETAGGNEKSSSAQKQQSGGASAGAAGRRDGEKGLLDGIAGSISSLFS